MIAGPLKPAIATSPAYGSRAAATCGFAGEHSCHLALFRQAGHEALLGSDQFQAVFQGEYAGHASRHIGADAMTQDDRRLDPPALPQLGQSIFQRERCRRLGIQEDGDFPVSG